MICKGIIWGTILNKPELICLNTVNFGEYFIDELWVFQHWPTFRTNIKVSKVKLATVVEGDPKAPLSIATTPRCRGGSYSFPRISPLYH